MRLRILSLALLIGLGSFQMVHASDPRLQQARGNKPSQSYRTAQAPKKVKYKKIKQKKFKPGKFKKPKNHA